MRHKKHNRSAPHKKTKFPCPDSGPQAALAAVTEHYQDVPDTKIDTRDGIRIDLPDAWVQLRASNTEPIMRIMAEAPDAPTCQNLIDQIKSLI